MTEQPKSSPFDPFHLLAGATVLSFAFAFWAIFAYAPVEASMGIVQKIFYFHVPSAIAAYVGFFVAFCGSIFYLLTGRRGADVLAVSGAEVGVVFCLMVVMSGPLWARKAWGTYWTGEPRLMLTLVLLLVFLAYLVVRALGGQTELTRKICAALAILGVANIPLVRYSVARWRGHHPRVITGEGGGIAPEMQVALLAGFVCFALLFAMLLIARYRQGRARVDIQLLERETALREHTVQTLTEEVHS